MSSAAVTVVSFYRQTHERVLALLGDLSDEQLAWRPDAGAHSIAWNLWHLARWADHLQASIPRMTPELGRRLAPAEQVWKEQGLAERWGWSQATLGFDETGTFMEEGEAAYLSLPGKDLLLDYARRAFAAADRAAGAIDDRQFQEPDATSAAFAAAYSAFDAGSAPVATTTAETTPADATVGESLMEHLVHENRHLGEMEYLRGQQGLD